MQDAKYIFILETINAHLHELQGSNHKNRCFLEASEIECPSPHATLGLFFLRRND